MTTKMLSPESMRYDESSSAPSPGGDPGKMSDEISVLEILTLLAERSRLIWAITGICAILGIVISLLLPVRYTATVTLLPPQQNSSMSAALSSQLGNLGGVAALAGSGFGLKNPNDMYVAMLQSRTVEDAMVQQFELMREYSNRYPSDARKTLEKFTTIDGSGKDGLIHISIVDRDPNRAAQLANGYVEQFRNLSQQLAITEAGERRLFFERELEQTKNKLADAEEALKKTEQATGVIQLDSQARSLIESAASLRAQITEREVEIQGMRTYATGENPQLAQAQRELDSLRGQLAKLGGSEDSNGELMVPKGRVPEAGLEYIRKARDVKYYETIFDIMARQFEIAKLDEAKQGALVQVVDPAITPDKRSSPKRAFIVIGFTVCGFFVGVLAALLQAGLLRLKADRETSAKLSYMKDRLAFWRSATKSVDSGGAKAEEAKSGGH